MTEMANHDCFSVAFIENMSVLERGIVRVRWSQCTGRLTFVHRAEWKFTLCNQFTCHKVITWEQIWKIRLAICLLYFV